MTRTMQMSMTKPHNGRIVILITCTILINLRIIDIPIIIRNCIGIGTQLHKSKWNRSPWKSMPHFVGSNKWIHIFRISLTKGPTKSQ